MAKWKGTYTGMRPYYYKGRRGHAHFTDYTDHYKVCLEWVKSIAAN
jgi:hypothetical protein